MLGSWRSSARDMFKQLTKQLNDASWAQKAVIFLAQRISTAIQLGDTANLLGTLLAGDDEEEFFDSCM